MALAWPAIVEQAVRTAVRYIDTAMAGFPALATAKTGFALYPTHF